MLKIIRKIGKLAELATLFVESTNKQKNCRKGKNGLLRNPQLYAKSATCQRIPQIVTWIRELQAEPAFWLRIPSIFADSTYGIQLLLRNPVT